MLDRRSKLLCLHEVESRWQSPVSLHIRDIANLTSSCDSANRWGEMRRPVGRWGKVQCHLVPACTGKGRARITGRMRQKVQRRSHLVCSDLRNTLSTAIYILFFPVEMRKKMPSSLCHLSSVDASNIWC